MASRGWDQFLNPQEPEQPSPSRSTKLVTRYDWDAFLNPTTTPQTWQIYPDQQDPITPPATITQQPGFLPKLFDYLSRTLYASANLAEEIVDKNYWYYPNLPFTLQIVDKNYWYYPPFTLLSLGLVNRGIQQAVTQGLTGERPGSYRNVALKLGLPDTPIIRAFEGIPVLGASWAGAAGFLGDWFLDPGTYVGVGAINRVGQSAQAAGKLKGLRSAQALAGQRDLITFAGVGPSSLPGRAGEIARQAQAAVFRAPEAAGEAILKTRLGQKIAENVTTKGVGPLRVVRERLRQREAEDRFLTRQAAREYGSMSREITDIANEYGLDPEELRRAIVFEAERKVRSAPVEALERVSKEAADPTALPGEAYRVIDLEASYVQSPTIQYTVKPGDTLSSISKRFGTTVESLAENNRISDPNRIRAGQTIEVPMPQEAQEILKSIRAAQPDRLFRERAAGVMTPEFESERIAYLHREVSDEFRRYLTSRRNRELADWLSQNRPILSVTHNAQRARTIDPDAYIREINQAAVEGRTKLVWIDAEGNIVPKGTKGATKQYVITDTPQKNPELPRMPILSEDPAVIELARERMTIRSVTSAQAIDDIIHLGTSEGWAVKATSKEAVEERLRQGWRTVQAPRFGDKFKDIYFPKEVADEIDKFMDLFRNQETRSLLRDIILGPLLWWRDSVLFIVPFGEYHTRNFGTGIIKNYYAGLLPGDTAYLQGQLFALLRQADMLAPRYGMADDIAQSLGQLKQAAIKTKDGKTYTLQQVLDWYEAERLGQGFIASTFSGGSATASEMLRGPGFELRRLNPFSRDNYAIATGKAIGGWVEDNLRGSLFIKKLKEGYPPHEAANFVRDYHFDYSELPAWADKLRKYQIAPFISWAVKNLPNELTTLIQQPGKVTGVVKFARAVEADADGPRPSPEEVPSFLLFPVYVGRDEEGNPRFANLLNAWGMLDLAEISTDFGRYAVNQLHGWIKEALEQSVNWDFYFQRNIVPPELERVGASMPSGPFGLHPRLEHALQTLKPYTLVERFYNPNTTPTQALIRSLTSYSEYTSDPYYSLAAPFRNFEDAMNYYRSQIFKYRIGAKEAMQRGDIRAAYLNERLADQWEQALRENFDRLYEQLPR